MVDSYVRRGRNDSITTYSITIFSNKVCLFGCLQQSVHFDHDVVLLVSVLRSATAKVIAEAEV